MGTVPAKCTPSSAQAFMHKQCACQGHPSCLQEDHLNVIGDFWDEHHGFKKSQKEKETIVLSYEVLPPAAKSDTDGTEQPTDVTSSAVGEKAIVPVDELAAKVANSARAKQMYMSMLHEGPRSPMEMAQKQAEQLKKEHMMHQRLENLEMRLEMLQRAHRVTREHERGLTPVQLQKRQKLLKEQQAQRKSERQRQQQQLQLQQLQQQREPLRPHSPQELEFRQRQQEVRNQVEQHIRQQQQERQQEQRPPGSQGQQQRMRQNAGEQQHSAQMEQIRQQQSNPRHEQFEQQPHLPHEQRVSQQQHHTRQQTAHPQPVAQSSSRAQQHVQFASSSQQDMQGQGWQQSRSEPEQQMRQWHVQEQQQQNPPQFGQPEVAQAPPQRTLSKNPHEQQLQQLQRQQGNQPQQPMQPPTPRVLSRERPRPQALKSPLGPETPSGASFFAPGTRMRVLLDQGWADLSQHEQQQMNVHLSAGERRFAVSSQGRMYMIDFTDMSNPTQTNYKTHKTRPLQVLPPLQEQSIS